MTDFSQYLKRYIDLTEDEETVLMPKLKRRKYLKGQYIAQGGCRTNF